MKITAAIPAGVVMTSGEQDQSARDQRRHHDIEVILAIGQPATQITAQHAAHPVEARDKSCLRDREVQVARHVERGKQQHHRPAAVDEHRQRRIQMLRFRFEKA